MQQQWSSLVRHSWVYLGCFSGLLRRGIILRYGTILLCWCGAILFYLHQCLCEGRQGWASLHQYWLRFPPHPLTHILYPDVWGWDNLLQHPSRL